MWLSCDWTCFSPWRKWKKWGFVPTVSVQTCSNNSSLMFQYVYNRHSEYYILHLVDAHLVDARNTYSHSHTFRTFTMCTWNTNTRNVHGMSTAFLHISVSLIFTTAVPAFAEWFFCPLFAPWRRTSQKVVRWSNRGVRVHSHLCKNFL